MGDYPTDAELLEIEKWDFTKRPVKDFVEAIRVIWKYADVGYFKLSGKNILRLQLHTGGWSGNESIIEAIEKNFIFWTMCWARSDRGGHFWFEIILKNFTYDDGKAKGGAR